MEKVKFIPLTLEKGSPLIVNKDLIASYHDFEHPDMPQKTMIYMSGGHKYRVVETVSQINRLLGFSFG